jgi:hypothetical protein
MGLGKNVGALIKARNLSYGDVARGTETDPQAIWLLVKRKSRRSALASKLSEYFQIALERLLSEDFDPKEAPDEFKPHPLQLRLEEAEAVKRMRGALPDWRRYVLGLAMIDNHQTQELLLRTMREAVPDKRVEEFVTVAPHAAARRKERAKG